MTVVPFVSKLHARLHRARVHGAVIRAVLSAGDMGLDLSEIYECVQDALSAKEEEVGGEIIEAIFYFVGAGVLNANTWGFNEGQLGPVLMEGTRIVAAPALRHRMDHGWPADGRS